MSKGASQAMTFWEHVEVLRRIVFCIIGAIVGVSAVAFFFKEQLFDIVFAPHDSDFIIYRLFCRLAEALNMPSICPGEFHVDLINTELTSQFMTHLSVSIYFGVLSTSPYIVYKLFGFISPALYDNERRYSFILIFCSFLLFFSGVLLNYFVIFPLSFRFLGTYQVSDFVVNQITLSSYISTLVMLSLLLGIVFEIPVLAFFLAKLGLISKEMLRRYRRHAFVVICIIAAIITPTADIFTLLLVACPIFILYELSILVVGRVNKGGNEVH